LPWQSFTEKVQIFLKTKRRLKKRKKEKEKKNKKKRRKNKNKGFLKKYKNKIVHIRKY